MKYLKRMKIRGFKKFENFDMNFNDKMNIIVGDNESGKSTILEAIDLVLSQKYKNYDKYIIKEFLNSNLIEKFKNNPSVELLPTITIDIEFSSDEMPKSGMFYGCNHNFEKGNLMYGIRFKCEIPSEIIPELLSTINSGKIPYEYYQLSWNTFQGDSYNLLKKPLNFLLIDNDNIDSSNSFNYYNKSLFSCSHDCNEQLRIKHDFRTNINELFDKLELNSINEHQKFGVNEKKLIFENIISIFDDDILIENKGKGKENLIKTEIALNKNIGKVEVLAIEEPENHLSFSNLKTMLEKISGQANCQIIVTTHESMVASSLNLKNLTWITQNKNESLKDLNDNDCEFFLKLSNNNLLQYILAPKVILVEGPTEFLLLPKIFYMIYNKSLEECGISIIACSGISYKRYFDIALKMKKRVAVITDNDKKKSNIDYKNKYNEENENINIFMDDAVENWTWEVCFYNSNKEKLDELIKIEADASYLFHGHDYGPVLGKMLNNKTEIAYLMYNSTTDFVIPEYVKDALEWIKD